MKIQELDHDMKELGSPLEFFLDEKRMLLRETMIFVILILHKKERVRSIYALLGN